MFISVKELSKSFKIQLKEKGLANSLKAFVKPKYKIVEAVKDVSFDIEEGEIVGYIGPNGSGKSTTIKMLCGILHPDSGTCIVNGMNPFADRKKYVSNIGVVFGQKSQLWWDIPVIESYELLRNIYKIPRQEYEKTKEELVNELGIKELLNVSVRQLSLGQRMKCEIVASLLHNPKILFLDEPTIGLDAVSKVQLREFIKKINKKRKVTIILTTHDMTDIEELAKRVIIIGKGQLLYDGSLSKIKKKFQLTKKLEIIFKDMKQIPKIKSQIIQQDKERVLIEVNTNEEQISKIIEKYTKECEIQDINIYENNIDNIILSLYKEYKI